MASQEFNPIDHARPPREEGWNEETEKIIEIIRNRGDQRIGQLIINAISRDIEYEKPDLSDTNIEDMTEEEAAEKIDKIERSRKAYKAKLEQKIWGIEADELAELLQKLQEDR